MEHKYVGILCILSPSIMWAIEPILAKLSYQNSDFIHTSTIRAIFVTLVALIYAITSKANFRVERKQLPALVYIAIVGTLFADLTYFLL